MKQQCRSFDLSHLSEQQVSDNKKRVSYSMKKDLYDFAESCISAYKSKYFPEEEAQDMETDEAGVNPPVAKKLHLSDQEMEKIRQNMPVIICRFEYGLDELITYLRKITDFPGVAEKLPHNLIWCFFTGFKLGLMGEPLSKLQFLTTGEEIPKFIKNKFNLDFDYWGGGGTNLVFSYDKKNKTK
uniref:Uncharacterized protein n=1 Tax=Meloidogyne enterolobii TaxID=390850 RepID=A0A6V7W2U0_MELEN|nr:unnamed protein product [Meloidogyne enterolobii]